MSPLMLPFKTAVMNLKEILSLAYCTILVGCSTSLPHSSHSSPQGAAQPPNVPSPTLATSQPAQPKVLKPLTTLTLNYQIETYHSQVFGRNRTYGIVLPPGYEQKMQARYPVVFLLHGGHGSPTSWLIKGKALEVVETLYASGKLPPSIIVTPDGNDRRESSPLFDPEYVNGQYGNVLSAIGDELVQEVKARYRTLNDPRFWAIGGLSSGGWGALNVGLHHPEHFKTLFSHSGYFTDKSGVENSPIEFVKTLAPETRRSLAIYLDAGEGDGKYLAQSQAFHQVLNQLQVENEFNEFPGGHHVKEKDTGWGVWHQHLADSATGGGVKEKDMGWGFWHQHLADSLTYVGARFRAAEKNRLLSKR